MYTGESWMNIRALRNQGLSYREIGRRLGVDRRTAKKLSEIDEPPTPKPRQRSSLVDPFAHVIEAWIEKSPKMTAKTIYEQLIPLGFQGGYTIIKEFVAKKRGEISRKATVRFETLPGYQAQVDFGKIPVEYLSGEKTNETLFAIQLGFSRYRVALLAPNERRSTLCDCLTKAFVDIDGVANELLFDNLKAVVKKPRTATEEAILQEAWILFCAHFGTATRACPPYRGQTKGKVERLIGTIKSGLLGSTFVDRAHLESELLMQTKRYNENTHSTTKMAPIERLEIERPYLLALPEDISAPEVAQVRKVSSESWISFEGNQYSVPALFAKKEMTVKPSGLELLFFDKKGALIWSHKRREAGSGATIMVEEHYDGVTGSEEAFDHLTRLQEMGLSPFEVEKRPLSVYAEVAGD